MLQGTRQSKDTKLATMLAMLRAPKGASVAELAKATGWQSHSIRGAISGTMKKKLALPVTSETVERRGRVYHIVGKS